MCERCGACVTDSTPKVLNDNISLSFVCGNCRGRNNFARNLSVF